MSNLDIMQQIMNQKNGEIEAVPELNEEMKLLAEGKRFTFDVINVPTDPLR